MDPWSRFFGCEHVSSGSAQGGSARASWMRAIIRFTWVCLLDEFTILVLHICRDEHLGKDANTSQLRHISRVTVSFRSLVRM